MKGFIPICSHCKKIRDDAGYWEGVEAYLQRHAEIQFSHALCPPCGTLLYGDLWPATAAVHTLANNTSKS